MTIIDDAADKVNEGKGIAKETKQYYKIGQYIKSEISTKSEVSPVITAIWEDLAQTKSLELESLSNKILQISKVDSKNIPDNVKIKSELALLYSQKKVLDISFAKALVNVGRLVYEKRQGISPVPSQLKMMFDELESIDEESKERKQQATDRKQQEAAERKRKNQEELERRVRYVDTRKDKAAKSNNNKANELGDYKSLEISILPKIFYFIAVSSLIGGIALFNFFHPGEPSRGMLWKPDAYLASIAWLSIGFIQFLLSLAIGRALAHLHRIQTNTTEMRNIMKKIAIALHTKTD